MDFGNRGHCGPPSNTNPFLLTVDMTPPALPEASRINARIPNCCRRNAQANPVMPAPITTALRMSPTACNFIKWAWLRVFHDVDWQQRRDSDKPGSGTAVESLVDFVRKYAANGSEVAIRHRRGYRMETWSYARIVQEAHRLARELESQGIGKGDAVLLWSDNSPEWIIVFFGCLLRGAVIVPVDHGSTVEFASRIAREVNAKLIFRARTLPDPKLPIHPIILESIPELTAARDSSPYAAPSLTRNDTLEVIFTSGTTSEPRGVVISHGNVLANIEPLEREIHKYLRYERIFHPLRFLNLLPLSHVFGQMLGLFIPPFLAGTVVFIESLQREIQYKVERDGLTRQFNKYFARAEKQHFLRRWWHFRRIRSRFGWKFWAFISGGAALPEHVEAFWTRLGYAAIQGYGMTETTSLISLNHPFHTAQGSIGKVFPGVEVRVDEN